MLALVRILEVNLVLLALLAVNFPLDKAVEVLVVRIGKDPEASKNDSSLRPVSHCVPRILAAATRLQL